MALDYLGIAMSEIGALSERHINRLVNPHLSGGLPAFHLVGLPEAEVREARDRVRAAIQNAQYEFPSRAWKCLRMNGLVIDAR